MLLIIETLFRALENKKIEREKKLREQFMQKYTCQILMRFEFFFEKKYIYIYVANIRQEAALKSVRLNQGEANPCANSGRKSVWKRWKVGDSERSETRYLGNASEMTGSGKW